MVMNNLVRRGSIGDEKDSEEGHDEIRSIDEEDTIPARMLIDEKECKISCDAALYRCTAGVEFGFKSNRLQLFCHWIIAVFIGVSLRMTTFPQAMIAADMGVNNYTRETSFLVAFGFTKALSNLLVGWASDRYGRKVPHIFGWSAGIILAALLLSTAITTSDTDAGWTRYVIADIFLGAQQGFTWTTNIFMFIDILGPEHRALASGISNSTGYLASAISTYAAAALTTQHAFTLVLVSSILGLSVSVFILKDTTHFVTTEVLMYDDAGNNEEVVAAGERKGSSSTSQPTTHKATKVLYPIESPAAIPNHQTPSFRTTFAATSWHNKSTAIICLSGLITNLVTSLVWGLVMIWGKQQTLSNLRLANLSSVFTFAKAFSQIIFSYVSDRRCSRKLVLLCGFSTVAAGLVLTATGGATNLPLDGVYVRLLVGGLVTGCGIGSVYCVMTGAVSDHTSPRARASAIGVYKLWRDSGYAFGGLLTGFVADVSGGSFVVTTLVVAVLVVVLIALIVVYYSEARYVHDVAKGEGSGDKSVRWHELRDLEVIT